MKIILDAFMEFILMLDIKFVKHSYYSGLHDYSLYKESWYLQHSQNF